METEILSIDFSVQEGKIDQETDFDKATYEKLKENISEIQKVSLRGPSFGEIPCKILGDLFANGHKIRHLDFSSMFDTRNKQQVAEYLKSLLSQMNT